MEWRWATVPVTRTLPQKRKTGVFLPVRLQKRKWDPAVVAWSRKFSPQGHTGGLQWKERFLIALVPYTSDLVPSGWASVLWKETLRGSQRRLEFSKGHPSPTAPDAALLLIPARQESGDLGRNGCSLGSTGLSGQPSSGWNRPPHAGQGWNLSEVRSQLTNCPRTDKSGTTFWKWNPELFFFSPAEGSFLRWGLSPPLVWEDLGEDGDTKQRKET